MKSYDLPFAKIILLKEDVAEVIINEGTEMVGAKVEKFHEFLYSHIVTPFSLLINKINSYSYGFEALNELGVLDELKAIAVVTYSDVSTISTEMIASFREPNKWDMKIFSNKDEAMAWLLSDI